MNEKLIERLKALRANLSWIPDGHTQSQGEDAIDDAVTALSEQGPRLPPGWLVRRNANNSIDLLWRDDVITGDDQGYEFHRFLSAFLPAEKPAEPVEAKPERESLVDEYHRTAPRWAHGGSVSENELNHALEIIDARFRKLDGGK